MTIFTKQLYRSTDIDLDLSPMSKPGLILAFHERIKICKIHAFYFWKHIWEILGGKKQTTNTLLFSCLLQVSKQSPFSRIVSQPPNSKLRLL